MGDILIRDVDEIAINKIDQEAKKAKLSRQVYLKNLVERLAYQEAFSEDQLHLEKVLNESQIQMTKYLQQQRTLYQKIIRIESILHVLFDMDDAELDEQLSKIIGKELIYDEE